MTIDLTTLDAHEQPSDQLKAQWKIYSRTDHTQFRDHPDIDELDTSNLSSDFHIAGHIPREKIKQSFESLHGCPWGSQKELKDAPIYFHSLLPGLLIVPSLVPPDEQKALLSKMVHRDLSNPTHQTNLHLHFNLPYRESSSEDSTSFFSYPPDSPVKFEPKDPEVHKPLSIKQVLDRRLSWVTLGGQYNWTDRIYPGELPPDFPKDIAGFLQALFPDTIAEAAIVNFYTPGDTMMMHRDVSEETDKGLVSLSLGCDGLFMIAPNDYGKEENSQANGVEDGSQPESEKKKQYLLLRLRSGDAIYMSEDSRYAWHGVPKVLKGTCPEFLADWPAEGEQFEGWKGWMQNKRVNLNVRQMKD
ncbi:hypothetical protein F5Y16DRAFT_73028 [Xylariaceae sp. FL0255]|nr:hypothetical protein F5Y16DRAFT_73028 [Xylariaceae sp. FL0255]